MRTLVTLILTALVFASSWAAIADNGLAQGNGQGQGNGGGNGNGGNGQGHGGAPSEPGNSGQANNAGGNGQGQGQGSSASETRNGGQANDAGPQGASGNADSGQGDGGQHDGSPGASGEHRQDGARDEGAGEGNGNGAAPANDDHSPQDGPGNNGNGARGPGNAQGGRGENAGPRTGAGSGPTAAPAKQDSDPTPSRADDTPRRRPQITEPTPLATGESDGGTITAPQAHPEGPSVTVLDAETGFRTARPQSRGQPLVAYDAPAARLTVEGEHAGDTFTSRITGLLEYQDGNGNGAYDLGEEVLQTVPIEGVVPDIFVGPGGDDSREVVYALLGGGILSLVFHLTNGGDVGAKYDVVVTGFPFRSDSSRLAVGASAETDGGVRILSVDGSPAVAGAGDHSVGYLSWVTEAIVDGTIVPVGWSVHVSHSATSEAAMIYWSYPQGAHILHDPEVGFLHLPPELLGDVELFVYGLVATGTVLLIGHELRRRRTW